MFKSRGRLFLTLFLVLAIPTAILTLLTAFFVSDVLKEQAVQQNRIIAQLVSKHLEEEFFGLRSYVESFATRWRVIDSLEDHNNKAVQEQLADLVEQNSKISRAILADTNGVLLVDYPHDPSAVGKNFSHRDWFKGAAQTERPYVSETYRRAALDQAVVVTIATKINHMNGELLGYLGGQYPIAELMEWLESVQPSDSERIAIFDQRGSQVLRVNAPETKDISTNAAIQNLLQKPEGTLLVDDLDGFGSSIVSHVSVPDLGWTVVVYQDQTVVFAPIRRLLGTISLFFLLALFALGLLGWWWNKVLFAYAEDLRRTNKELENFCYSIAHDLRAPLRAMKGFTSIITEDYAEKLSDEGKECAHRVGNAAEKMDRLISDLLEYGSIAYRNLEFEEIDLDRILKTTLESFSARARQTNARIQVRYPLGKAIADETMLQKVLSHLVGNALKYVDPGREPEIAIWTEPAGKVVRFWIRDNGVGIAPEHQEKIFGVFERLHTDRGYAGTGIGLAIVRKAAERMGGRVGVESSAGKGSAFWIELPIR